MKVVNFNGKDVHVYQEFTRDVTYFNLSDPSIMLLKRQRIENYKKGRRSGDDRDSGGNDETNLY